MRRRIGPRRSSEVRQWVRGAAIEAGEIPLEAEKVAIFAHYSTGNVVSRSAAAYVDALERAGYRTVVISTGTSEQPLQWPGVGVPATAIVRRGNEGYDFGSWAVGLEILREHGIDSARTILTNDSMAGPFAASDIIFDSFERSGVEVWGITNSFQMMPHIQSYFLGFAPSVLAEPVWRRFFNSIRQQPEKMDYVYAYEFGVTRIVRRYGFSWDVLLRPDVLGVNDANPTIAGWKAILDEGVPMVKRTILKDPTLAPDGHTIAEEVRSRFGVAIDEWVGD